MMNRRNIGCVLSLVIVALYGCGVSAITEIVLPTSLARKPVVAAPEDLRVMSFNIRTKFILDGGNHWNHRKGLLCEVVRRFNPDLLATQECGQSQAQYIVNALGGYEFVGAGRNDGAQSGEMCGVFFKRSRLTKLKEGHFWLSDNPAKPGSKSWGTFFPRMVTWVKLRPKSGGADFYFFNTHMDAFSSHAREKASHLLRQKIQEIVAGAPVILAGDFNAGEGSGPYQTLTARRSKPWDVVLDDTLRAINPIRGSAESTRHGFDGDIAGERIDWILASPDFKTVSASINREKRGSRYPSDHYPVTAILRLRSEYAAAQRYGL